MNAANRQSTRWLTLIGTIITHSLSVRFIPEPV